MLLRATGNEMDDDERMQDWKRWLLRSGLIIVALLVIGSVMSQSSSKRNPVLHSFVAVEPDTRPLVLADIRKGDAVSEEDYYEKFSMVVGVFFKKGGSSNRCTGVLVTKKKVLTAGHCCDPDHTSDHAVMEGIALKGDEAEELYIAEDGKALELYKSGDEPNEHKFAYDPAKSQTETPLYDLCMITLKDGVEEDPPIKLPASGADPPTGDEGYTMIGYGRKGDDNDELNTDYKLFSGAAKIVECPDKLQLGGDPDSADYDMERWETVKELVFCTEGTKEDSHACSGDSGGPLLGKFVDNKRMVYGILSDGKKPCENGPNSYSDLAKAEFAAWVRAKAPDYSDA